MLGSETVLGYEDGGFVGSYYNYGEINLRLNEGVRLRTKLC